MLICVSPLFFLLKLNTEQTNQGVLRSDFVLLPLTGKAKDDQKINKIFIKQKN